MTRIFKTQQTLTFVTVSFSFLIFIGRFGNSYCRNIRGIFKLERVPQRDHNTPHRHPHPHLQSQSIDHLCSNWSEFHLRSRWWNWFHRYRLYRLKMYLSPESYLDISETSSTYILENRVKTFWTIFSYDSGWWMPEDLDLKVISLTTRPYFEIKVK